MINIYVFAFDALLPLNRHRDLYCQVKASDPYSTRDHIWLMSHNYVIVEKYPKLDENWKFSLSFQLFSLLKLLIIVVSYLINKWYRLINTNGVTQRSTNPWLHLQYEKTISVLLREKLFKMKIFVSKRFVDHLPSLRTNVTDNK